jgi:hypothetical protein
LPPLLSRRQLSSTRTPATSGVRLSLGFLTD